MHLSMVTLAPSATSLVRSFVMSLLTSFITSSAVDVGLDVAAVYVEYKDDVSHRPSPKEMQAARISARLTICGNAKLD